MGRSIEQLANQQVLRWLQERRLAQELSSTGSSAATSRVRNTQKPIITMSRQYGAYGGEVGRIVSRILGIDYHAQELVHQIAAHADVRKQVVEALDERTQSSLQVWVDELISLRRFETSDYLQSLSKTILAIGRHNRGVIVGRGGHLILDPERTLRVRAICPFEKRVSYVAEREGMSTIEARAKVTRVDGERKEFFQRHFGTDTSDPEAYDLVINTGSLSLEACAQVVAEMYRQRFG